MTPLNKRLLIAFIVLGVVGLTVAMLYAMQIYDFRYNPPPGAGICYHMPHEIIFHDYERKPLRVYESYYYQ